MADDDLNEALRIAREAFRSPQQSNFEDNDAIAYSKRLEKEQAAKEFGEVVGQTWPVQAAKDVIQAAKAPARVYQGELDPSSSEAMKNMFDLAGTAVLGSAAAPAPKGAIGMGFVNPDLVKKGYKIEAYHGTASPEDFRTWNLSDGIGVHFGEKKAANTRISTLADEREDIRLFGKEGIENSRVIPAMLKIRKPLVVHDFGDDWQMGLHNFLASKFKDYNLVGPRKFAAPPSEEMVKFLRSKGYDGLKYDNMYEGGISYVVFDPEKQIASQFADPKAKKKFAEGGAVSEDLNEAMRIARETFRPAGAQNIELNDAVGYANRLPTNHPREELEKRIALPDQLRMDYEGVMLPNRAADIRTDDQGTYPVDAQGNRLPFINRPMVLPVVRDEGELRPAMPYAVEMAGNIMGGIFSPVKGAGMVAGAGPVRRAAEAAAEAAPRQLTPQGLYSHAQEVLKGLPQEKGTPEQFRSMLLKQGTSPEELKWAGFDEWAAGRKTATKQEMDEFLRSSQPEIKETVLGYSKSTKEQLNDFAQRAYGRNFDELDPVRQDGISTDIEILQHPKFETYKLPGGENYREVLLSHDPSARKTSQLEAEYMPRIRELEKKWMDLREERSPFILSPTQLTEEQAAKLNQIDAEMAETQRMKQILYREFSSLKDGISRDSFRSSHWDEPNVLAHIRMVDRSIPVEGFSVNNRLSGNTSGFFKTREEAEAYRASLPESLRPETAVVGADGPPQKVLNVEEIQSDWGQKGKKEGFQTSFSKEEQDELNSLFKKFANNEFVEGSPEYVRATELEKKRQQSKMGLPSAPFVTTTQGWTDLALKRVLTEAAKGEYDAVTFTPGIEQAKRYSLSQHVSELKYDPTTEKLTTIGHDGLLNVHSVKPDQLPEYVGPEIAEKLLKIETPESIAKRLSSDERLYNKFAQDTFAAPPADEMFEAANPEYIYNYLISNHRQDLKLLSKQNTLTGLDLEIGGEGMKGYYDKIVPNQLSKLLKRIDPNAKIEKTKVPVPPDKSVDINGMIDQLPETQEMASLAEARAWFYNLPLRRQNDIIEKFYRPREIEMLSVRMTPELREKILKEGFRQFADGGAVNDEPSTAQKEAGNYKKKHIRHSGFDIAIENEKGGYRSGTDKNGKQWRCKMPADYGYIKRTEGADGDHVDVYVGPNENSDKVFVVNQRHHDTKKFDEHKCMLGYSSRSEALKDYHRAFSDGKAGERIKSVAELTLDEFKDWIKNGDTTKPLNNFRRGGAVDEQKKKTEDRRGPRLLVDKYPTAYLPNVGRQVANDGGLVEKALKLIRS